MNRDPTAIAGLVVVGVLIFVFALLANLGWMGYKNERVIASYSVTPLEPYSRILAGGSVGHISGNALGFSGSSEGYISGDVQRMSHRIDVTYEQPHLPGRPRTSASYFIDVYLQRAEILDMIQTGRRDKLRLGTIDDSPVRCLGMLYGTRTVEVIRPLNYRFGCE